MASSIEDLKTAVSSRLGFARSNNFLVLMPSLEGASASGLNIPGIDLGLQEIIPSVPGLTKSTPTSRELNLLCKNVSMPGKQLLTGDRRVGMVNEKMVYGYGVAETSITFHLLNDYGALNYLNKWRALCLAETRQAAKYKTEYQKDVVIYQLRKPFININGPTLGPINLDLDVGGGKVYGVKLKNAFPTSISAINFSNEQDGLVEVTATLAYTNWTTNEVNVFEDIVGLNINIGQIF